MGARGKDLAWFVILLVGIATGVTFRSQSLNESDSAPTASEGTPVARVSGGTDCRTNMELLAKHTKLYWEDHEGRYPATIDELKSYGDLPICDAGGSYAVTNKVESPGNIQGYQSYYLITCSEHIRLGHNSCDGFIDPSTAPTFKL